jgi:hypothetical protein
MSEDKKTPTPTPPQDKTDVSESKDTPRSGGAGDDFTKTIVEASERPTPPPPKDEDE